jgi:hypothetical protein
MWCRYKYFLMALALGLLAQGQVPADDGFYLVPAVSVYGVHDDNIFFTPVNEASDYIARISPALIAGYESDRFTGIGSYTFDAEAYHENSDLDSAHVRGIAELELEYLATERLILSLDAEHIETDTPIDLSLVPGGEVPGFFEGRVGARRTTINPEVSYQFSPAVRGTAAYSYTDDQYGQTNESKTQEAEAYFDHRTSDANTISYGYLYRDYRFYSVAEDLSVLTMTADSHTPWLGLDHEFTAKTSFVGRAGPRFDDDTVEPYLLLSLHHERDDVELSLNYERDETTLLGETGKQEYQSVYGTWVQRFGPSLDLHISPGYARVEQLGADQDIYQLQLTAYYRINRFVNLSAAYDFNSQDARDGTEDPPSITRNVFALGLTFTYPRR